MNVLARKPAGQPALMPEEVRERLGVARAKHSALLVQQQQAAEASLHSPEGERRYQEIIAEMVVTSGEIDRLEGGAAGAWASSTAAGARRWPTVGIGCSRAFP